METGLCKSQVDKNQSPTMIVSEPHDILKSDRPVTWANTCSPPASFVATSQHERLQGELFHLFFTLICVTPFWRAETGETYLVPKHSCCNTSSSGFWEANICTKPTLTRLCIWTSPQNLLMYPLMLNSFTCYIENCHCRNNHCFDKNGEKKFFRNFC